MGEDHTDPLRKAEVDFCALRIGLKKGVPLTGWFIDIQANGMRLHNGPVDGLLVETAGALAYLQVPIRDLAALYTGTNTLRFVISGLPETSMEEVLIGVFFREHDLSL